MDIATVAFVNWEYLSYLCHRYKQTQYNIKAVQSRILQLSKKREPLEAHGNVCLVKPCHMGCPLHTLKVLGFLWNVMFTVEGAAL